MIVRIDSRNVGAFCMFIHHIDYHEVECYLLRPAELLAGPDMLLSQFVRYICNKRC